MHRMWIVRGRRRRFLAVGIMICLVVILGAALVQWLEYRELSKDTTIRSFPEALWWSIVTITTVGYGDRVPVTGWGMVAGSIMILFGFVLFSLFTGLIASELVEERMKGAKGLKPVTSRDHIVICGWNDTVYSMMRAFSERKIDAGIVLVMNKEPDFFAHLEAEYPRLMLQFIRGDYAQKDILTRANVRYAKQVIVIADANLPRDTADDRSIIVANTVRYISRDVLLTVQLLDMRYKSHLEQIGADNIIVFDELGGYLLANNAIQKHSAFFFTNLLRSSDNEVKIDRVPSSLIGKSCKDLQQYYREEFSHILIGIITEKQKLALTDIFSDEQGAVDAFIKQALELSQSKFPEQRYSLKINPPDDYQIRKEDLAILIT